ncbi:hypothetical protein ACTSKR_02405 [Chitinibacteraceae bacterium HSL-7]
MRLFKTTAALACVVLLSACAQFKMTPPQASIENVQKAKAAVTAPLAVGTFTAQPAVDGSVSIRGNPLVSPQNDSMAAYLGETLRVDLQSAGRLDAAALRVISGELLKSELNAHVGTGTASLQARFKVMQGESPLFDKVLGVSSQWDSPFMGIEAIPLAAGQYEALYRKLVGTLFDDAEFRALPAQ